MNLRAQVGHSPARCIIEYNITQYNLHECSVLICLSLLLLLAGLAALSSSAAAPAPAPPSCITLSLQPLQDRRAKAAFYQHMREQYPHLLATSSSSSSISGAGQEAEAAVTMTVDTSLHPLVRLSLSPEDVRSLYTFLKAGPQHADADKGIHIGADMSRESRTLVYRAMVDVARRLDSKTKEYRGVRGVLNMFSIYLYTPLS
jgi:hypothetical protein